MGVGNKETKSSHKQWDKIPPGKVPVTCLFFCAAVIYHCPKMGKNTSMSHGGAMGNDP